MESANSLMNWKACLMMFIAWNLAIAASAQIDTEFWFAPPEVTEGHGDTPIYLRFSSQDKPAKVTVTQPARDNFLLTEFNLAANTALTIQLSGDKRYLETILPATVMKTGIKITATAPITVYYEVTSFFNGEIFSLKGKNAIGNRFVIPGQAVYDVSTQFTPLAGSSIDIVATRDNTVVKVKPNCQIIGHERQSLITIKLNAGETYSLQRSSVFAMQNCAGTIVESNNPIAITIKDDSVIKSTCRDLLGDQIVPVKVAGKEYIAPLGFLNAPEYIFVTATEDNTEIYTSGINVPVSRLKTGQTYQQELTQSSVLIKSNKRVYVLHVTGFGCEVAMAVLPPITCTGSKRISFTRSTPDFFGLDVLVKKEGISSFVLNGSPNLVLSTYFAPVSGTKDEWYSARIRFSEDDVPVGMSSTISNDKFSFQVGIINGDAGTTCRYGYFSSFSTLFIGDDINMCEGDHAVIDAGPGKGSYLWNTGAITQTIDVTQPGLYSVTVATEDCVLSDTIRVNVRKAKMDLGPDVQVCPNGSIEIDGKDNFDWLWSDGSSTRYLEVDTAGTYWVSIHDNDGCPASDTIRVTNYVDRFNESVKLKLNDVSVDTAVQENIIIDWLKDNGDQPEDLITELFKRVAGTTPWEKMYSSTGEDRTFAAPGNETEKNSYEWYAALTNQCGNDKLKSAIHNTMVLTGSSNLETGEVSLAWNPYGGWPLGVDRYEIWRKLEGHAFEFVGASGNDVAYAAKLAFDGFSQDFVIRALEEQGTGESWSNVIHFDFDIPVIVYNVFTPNDDPENPFFTIANIGLYKESRLMIMNRWGKRVFEATGYQNDWDGGDSPSGIYYYQLDLKNGTPPIKGPLSIVR